MSFIRHSFATLALFCAFPLAAQVSFNSATYPAPANTEPGYAIAADINKDGSADVISTDGFNAQLLIWYGTGSGKFGSAELVGNLDGMAVDLAVGDFNGDGKLDIVAATGQNQAVDVLINTSNHTFSKSSISTPDWPNYLAVGDFNHDGKVDIAVSSYKSATGTNYLQIYFGKGDGTFSAGSQTLPLPSQAYYMIARDLNKDGRVDLLSVGAPATIFLNNGDGTFTPAQTLNAPGGGTYVYGAISDFNGDTAPDLFLTNNQFCGEGCGWIKSLDSWVNDGTGHFTLKQSLQPINASSVGYGVLGDLNYDGKIDMAFWADDTLEYALGKGTGTFGSAQQWGPLHGPYAGYYNPLLAHDLNNNGLMDIVSTSTDSIQVLLNTSAKPDCLPPNSGLLGSKVCSLVSGQKVNSTFPVRAAANGPVDIWRMEEWLDGKKVYQVLSNQLRNNLTTTVGSHTLTIATVDVLNNVSKKSISFSAISCTAPASAGVRICIPSAGSTVSSPVSVVAASSPASGTSIASVRLYVDSVAKYTTTGSRMSTSVSLAVGTHHLTVVAYEKNGSALKASETITVH